MDIDALVLARIQFAANITFHILFPTITMGLAWLLVYFKTKSDRSGDRRWTEAYRFWVKVFALSFALGVVSGITMSFQFGTNWPGFMETVGNVAGPLLGYEVLTAFFLEATFLGVMLFGRKRVSNRVHTVSTWMVAIGTSLSAFWILALNSWMQTPAGYEMRDGVAHVTQLGRGDLQPVHAVSTDAHDARVCHHRGLRRDRVIGLPLPEAGRERCQSSSASSWRQCCDRAAAAADGRR